MSAPLHTIVICHHYHDALLYTIRQMLPLYHGARLYTIRHPLPLSGCTNVHHCYLRPLYDIHCTLCAYFPLCVHTCHPNELPDKLAGQNYSHAFNVPS